MEKEFRDSLDTNFRDSLDTNFRDSLDTNIHSLLTTMFEISGKYSMNKKRANEWVLSQKTKLKRRVAKHFINNTTYVTFNEYFLGIGKLIKDNYETIVKDADKIIMCISLPKKSQYFTSIIAMHYIRKYNFREPDYFVKYITVKNTQDPIIIIDDMSYSGSQMRDMFTKIYKDCVKKYENDQESANLTPKIHLLLYGINNFSERRLSMIENMIITEPQGPRNIPTKKFINVASPFKIYYYKKFELLIDVNAEMAHLIHYFFSPYLSGAPVLSIYFDHKIADDVSTFMKTIMYGPIIPKSYALESFAENNEEYGKIFQLDIDKNHFPITNKEISGLENRDIYQILPNLVQKYASDDVIDKTDIKIHFLPFINNCNINDTINKISESMFYNEFLFPEETEYVTDEYIKNQLSLIYDDKNKCIQPFYKRNLMVSPRKSRNTRRNSFTIKSRRTMKSRKTPKTI
jgi:hypothetical protein